MAGADRTGGWTAPSGRYNAAIDMVDRNVEAGRGGRLAFMDPKRLMTYAELQAACNRMANVLPRLGIGRERRIVLIMLDDVDFPVAFWGAIKAGVVPVPLNTLLPPETWRYMIEDSRADAVVVSAELLPRARPMLEEIAAARHLHVIVAGGKDDDLVLGFERLMERSEPVAEAAGTSADEVAFWLYSSGSTGPPKGTRHLHASPMATARLFGQGVLGIGADDVVFSAA
jgi:acyl-coenzyme A synthetase/AMP-(fatty) acid ligase